MKRISQPQAIHGLAWLVALLLFFTAFCANSRAGYFNPNTGRFWSMDSYEGRTGDPLSLHKYLYCRANPVNGGDPSGHEFTLVSTLVNSYWQTAWRSGLANVTSSFVINRLVNPKYKWSIKEGMWDFVTGAAMGVGSGLVGNAAKALSAKIGMRVMASAVFNFGPPAMTAAISTGEWVLKKQCIEGEDVNMGEVMGVFLFTAGVNYVLYHSKLLDEKRVDSAKKLLEGVEQLRNGTAPRGFGSLRHVWSTLKPAEREAYERVATAVTSNADLGAW